MKQAATDMFDEAARWVARMDAGHWSRDDEDSLTRWLSADPRRRGILLQAQAGWFSLDPSLDATANGVQPRRLLHRRSVVLAGSGLVAASLAGGFIWSGSRTSYSTALGEIRRVPLEDGSIATVNTASQIEVNLASQRRDVRITRGEAWFEVAKDVHRPFVVEAGGVRVQAVGTAFSVRRQQAGATILVNEGVVEAWAAYADGNKIRLTVGDRAFVGDNSAIRVEPSSASGVDRALEWRSGTMSLSGQRLIDVIDDFNRYNVRKLVLVDNKLAGEQFDGVFQLADPEGFAMAVRDSLSVPVDTANPLEIRIGRPAS